MEFDRLKLQTKGHRRLAVIRVGKMEPRGSDEISEEQRHHDEEKDCDQSHENQQDISNDSAPCHIMILSMGLSRHGRLITPVSVRRPGGALQCEWPAGRQLLRSWLHTRSSPQRNRASDKSHLRQAQPARCLSEKKHCEAQ